jgi:hypothetical protein
MDKLMGNLAALSSKTEAAEKRILSIAQARSEVVRKRIEDVKPIAPSDDALGQEYMELIQERAHLELVIRLAEKRIAELPPTRS